jgi:hypothetical protein
VETGVLEKEYSFERASRIPSFAITKKNGGIRFVSGFSILT